MGVLLLLQILIGASVADPAVEVGPFEVIADREADCIDLLKDLVAHFMTHQGVLSTIARNSGQDYNDFGRYADCNKQAGTNYILATVTHEELTVPVAFGLCFPEQCEVSDFND